MIWKFLHIATMFTAATLLFATELILYRAARQGDIAGLRAIHRHGHTVGNVGVILFLVGVGFGLIAAVTGGFNLLAPWLLIAYVLVGALVLLGFLVEEPHIARIVKAAEESGDNAPSDELRTLVGNRRGEAFLALSAALYVAIIFVMVVKPLS